MFWLLLLLLLLLEVPLLLFELFVMIGPVCPLRFGVGDTSGMTLTMPGLPVAYGSRITFKEVHLWFVIRRGGEFKEKRLVGKLK